MANHEFMSPSHENPFLFADICIVKDDYREFEKSWENKYNYYMSLDNHSDQNYSGDPYQEVGRQLVHLDGTRETAVMKKVFWDYLDWLLDKGAILSISLVLDILDYERSNEPLGEALSTYLYEGAEYREELGLPNPPWLQT